MFGLFGLFGRKPQLAATITNGPGKFDFDVVGESFHQDALAEICGGKCFDGHRIEVEAMLIPEDENPHDPKAVRVEIHGHHVGHLSRKLARSFRKVLAEIAPAGTPAKCRAIIVGGWDRGDGDQGHFGVKLDLPIG